MSLFNNKTLPSKIKYNCVFQAIIELQYQTTIPVEILTFKLFDALGNEYNRPYRTPMQDIPQIVRQSTPGMEKAICYYIKSAHDVFNIGIGDGLLSLQIINFSYGTWDTFINEFKKVYEKISSFIDKKEQIGVRYVNVFEDNVLPHLNIDLNVYKQSILEQPLVLSWQNKDNEHMIKTSIINEAVINYNDLKTGETKVLYDTSIIDIDCICRDIEDKDLLAAISENHDIVKQRFFNLCKEDYIENVLIPIEESE